MRESLLTEALFELERVCQVLSSKLDQAELHCSFTTAVQGGMCRARS